MQSITCFWCCSAAAVFVLFYNNTIQWRDWRKFFFFPFEFYSIVGFYVEPLSVKHTFLGGAVWDGKGDAPQLSSCQPATHLDYDSVKEHQKVFAGPLLYTYGVEWRQSEVYILQCHLRQFHQYLYQRLFLLQVRWASRWDVYLSMNHAIPDKVHWFSIVNSVLIVLFLAFMVAMILIRTLNRDISKYNKVSFSFLPL